MSASIRNSIQTLKDEIAGYRRALHENPQTAYEETFASDFNDKILPLAIEYWVRVVEKALPLKT